jgi:hypothetical protein
MLHDKAEFFLEETNFTPGMFKLSPIWWIQGNVTTWLTVTNNSSSLKPRKALHQCSVGIEFLFFLEFEDPRYNKLRHAVMNLLQDQIHYPLLPPFSLLTLLQTDPME